MDHQRAMLGYAVLAGLSRERGQVSTAGRFLIMCGAAAVRAGWPEVADRCRELLLGDNPRHLLGRWPDFPTAMRAPDFTEFLKQQQRFCPSEQAEHLLHQQNRYPLDEQIEAGQDPASYALEQIERLRDL